MHDAIRDRRSELSAAGRLAGVSESGSAAQSRAVDAKSMYDLMTLMAEHGAQLVLIARGADATAAIQAIGDLFDCNFRPPA